MNSTFGLLSKWPLIRQIREGADGTGLDAMSEKTRAMHAGIDDAQVARSIVRIAELGAGSSFEQGWETDFESKAIQRVRSAREIFVQKARRRINC
jgi:hypothetical protein